MTTTNAARQDAWRLANPGKQAEYNRRYRLRHPDRVAAQYASLRQEVLAAYGSRCVCCGEAQEPFLTIDHTDGSGADHRETLGNRRSASGATTYRWLKKNNYPSGFRVLCWNCNCARRQGPCPHERTK